VLDHVVEAGAYDGHQLVDRADRQPHLAARPGDGHRPGLQRREPRRQVGGRRAGSRDGGRRLPLHEGAQPDLLLPRQPAELGDVAADLQAPPLHQREDLHTQFFKSSSDNARITILTHIDLRSLRFRKAEDRNCNNLTITAALFDRNGNYVTGNQKLLEMRLKDDTLEKRADNGFTVRSAFDVKPGTYLVRLVVRDSEGQQMSAANGAVEIP
jgi:hypothetical protein